jgi:integrase
MSEARKKPLTDRFLRSLKPLKSTDPGYRKAWWDTAMPGLCIRPGERVTFYVAKRSRHASKFVWTKLGDYPALSLAEARVRAGQIVTALADGKPIPAPARNTVSFADASDLFIEQCLDGKRTRVEIEQLIRGKLIPKIGHLPLTAITHDDLVTLLRGIADRSERTASGRIISGGPHAARKSLVHLRVMLRWAAFNRIGGLQADPSSAIPASELLRGRKFNRARDRVLSDAEIRVIWEKAGFLGYPFGDLVRSLIRTGQRLSEIAEMRWSEIGGATLTIPAERMKNRRVHALPLTPRMQELLASLPRFEGGDFVFSTTYGKRPVSGHSKYKVKFDRLLGAEIGQWQLHDLRRSVRTGLARAGVPVFDAELIIGHQQAGVHGVYDRHRYSAEKLAGLLKWEELFSRILDETGERRQAA